MSSSLKEPGDFFHKFDQDVPTFAWATQWEFFQKIPNNLPKTYLAGSFKHFQKKLSIWFNFTMNSQKTHWVYGWVCYGQSAGYFLKELSMSGSGIWWAHFDQIYEWNHQPFSKRNSWNSLMGSFKTYSQLTYWSHQDQSGEYIENLPTFYPLGKLRVNCLKTLNKLSMCLPGNTPVDLAWTPVTVR